MIGFGCAITSRAKYETFAAPGIALASEPDSIVVARESGGTLSHAYNAILDELATVEGLEGLVLLHQDLEITNPSFCDQLRRYLAEPEVAIVGAAGAENVRGLTWWEPGPVVGDYEWAYRRNGGGAVTMDNWTNYIHAEGPHPVDAVDGMLLALSPWAVANLRFDESLDPSAHGYDIDICLQAREADRRVIVGGGLGVTHHHELEVLTDSDEWVQTHVRVAEKWKGRFGEDNGHIDWERRARIAEAEAGAAKIARDELNLLRNESDRRSLIFWQRIELLERRLELVKRLAAPLRPARRALHRARERRGRGPDSV